MHPHCDTSTRLIRTSELNDIFCRFAKDTIANLCTRGIIYYTLERDSARLTPGIQCNRPVIIQASKLITREGLVKDALPAVQLVAFPAFSHNTAGYMYMLTDQSTTMQADIRTNLKRGSCDSLFLYDRMPVNFLVLPLA